MMAYGSRFGVIWCVFVVCLALASGTARAQDAMFVDSTGNVGIGTNTPANSLHVLRSNGTAKLLVEEGSATTGARELFELRNNGGPFFIFKNTDISQSYSFAMGATGDFLISHQQTAGVQMRLTPSGNLTISGSLSQGSSRAIKKAIEPVDGRQVLQKVASLPISRWSYESEGAKVKHMGPMAEDFYSAFALGHDSSISTLDTSGVALAAIQALNDMLRDKDQELEELRGSITELEARLKQLEVK